MADFELEKSVWTESDFEAMGWHDSSIWGMSTNPDEYEYLIDLDYIFKWVPPEESEKKYFSFWVSPVTMVFSNVGNTKINLESPQGKIEVADLHMENPHKTPDGSYTQYTFRFECQEGEILIDATGYKLFVRRAPVLQQSQSLEFQKRGGVSFAQNLEEAK